MDLDRVDPKGLIRESYRMTGISIEECRSIFVDWVLSLPPEEDPQTAMRALLDAHRSPGHPMTEILSKGLDAYIAPRRRGGRAARFLNRPKN